LREGSARRSSHAERPALAQKAHPSRVRQKVQRVRRFELNRERHALAPSERITFAQSQRFDESLARGNPGGPLYGGAADVKILLARSGGTIRLHRSASV